MGTHPRPVDRQTLLKALPSRQLRLQAVLLHMRYPYGFTDHWSGLIMATSVYIADAELLL